MSGADFEAAIVALIREHGPVTGADIRAALGSEQPFEQWKTCMVSPLLTGRRVGRRYLRLDEKVEGYARLSPSILREFLTYTVVGLTDDLPALSMKTEELASRVREISAAKLRLVTRVMNEILTKLPVGDMATGRDDLFAVLLAGDIVYEMAHDAPRPERSTGRMVRGSDLDLVILVDDDAPTSLEDSLDEAIYERKYRYLINPSIREEIDYTIKRMARVREQVGFSTLKEMVPCKILDEAVLLAGSPRLFQAAKDLLEERGIPARLMVMEREAAAERRATEARLLTDTADAINEDDRNIFCGTEEVEEFD